MDPGDGLYFHANLLHRSDQNRSDKPRWAMICCYNAARNDPYMESHHPRYTPLIKVKDEEILRAAQKRFGENEVAGTWLDPEHETSAKALQENK
jgi:ectoine hydroxylase-related dioxygenase (phytanoyl-CoA dioxygenase family)